MNRSIRRLAGIILVGVVLLVAGAAASGRVGYVTTRGVSMEPTYHAGDLVVLARSDRYHQGQIVAYRGMDDTVSILHRIVGGDAGGFAVRGDNNQSTDPMRPRADQILGRALLHAPGVGGLVDSRVARVIVPLALLGLIGFLVKRPAPRPGAAYGSRRAGDRSTTAWKTFLAMDVVLLAAVGLTFGFVTPASPRALTPYHQTGVLAYQATVPVSDTYPTGMITTGDPVFVKLLNAVGVSFAYSTDAPGEQVTGTIGLEATLSTASGWHSTLPLVAPTPLADGAAEVTARLDLARIQTLVADVAEASGVGTRAVDIAVTGSARVAVGSADPVAYNAVLPLHLDSLALTLGSAEVAPSSDGPAVVSTTSLTPTAAAPVGRSDGPGQSIRPALLVLLLLSAAATAVVWPAGPGDSKVAVVRTPALGIHVADLTNQIQVPDRGTLVQVALKLRTTIVQGADGWEGVFGPGTLYWAITPHDLGPESAVASADDLEAPARRGRSTLLTRPRAPDTRSSRPTG